MLTVLLLAERIRCARLSDSVDSPVGPRVRTSELAVATVLAAYMGGLALGAWLVELWLPRISRPVLV